MIAAFFARGGQVTHCPARWCAWMNSYGLPPATIEAPPAGAPPAEATREPAEAAPGRSTPPAAAPTVSVASSPADRAALRVLRELSTHHAGGVPLEAWRLACQAPGSGITSSDRANTRRQCANRSIRALVARCAVTVRGGIVQEAGAAIGCAPGLPAVGMAERAGQAERIAA